MIPKPLVAAAIKPMMLSILAEGPSYGYLIISRVQTLSKGKMNWTTGTLYPLLHRLEKEGLVESYWHKVPQRPRRKYYKLTPKGEEALATEKTHWLDVQAMLAELWGMEPSGG